MRWFLKELLSGRDSVSSTRFKSLIALIVSIIYTFYGENAEILIVWVVAAFVPQGVQKFAERRNGLNG